MVIVSDHPEDRNWKINGEGTEYISSPKTPIHEPTSLCGTV